MTSLATAVGGMKHWDWCPICRGGLDTGLECDQCGADFMPIYTAFKESLSGGNPGEPKACTPAEERGIGGATGAGQPPDGKPGSTVDSAERRSPDGTERTPSPDESNRHFDRGCFVIMELMQAYERRVRSDCTPVEIDKRPWECAEYLKASEYLRKVWPPPEPQGWQPIETAPRDTPILLSIFASGDPERERLVVVGGSSDGVTWIDHYDYEIHPPTHWMPLPAPPLNTGAGE